MAADRERAARLREAGLSYREIADYLGVGSGTVYRWLNPEFEERLRLRSREWKRRNAGVCDTCGGPTNGSKGLGRAASRCLECLKWSREAILEAFREWGHGHGGNAPRAVDAYPGAEGHGRLPAETTVQRYFGSWNAAIAAAGLPLNQDKSVETYEAMRDAVLAGESVASIAARYGVTVRAVYQRLENHGTPVSELRRAA